MSALYHILVVDDDDLVRSAVAELLQSRGYEVSLAGTAAEALYILTRRGADLVVLDIELGDQNGLGLLAKIKATAPRVRVVILTGRGYDEELWQAARANGADGYLSKALPPSQLLMEVNRWVRHGTKVDGSSPSPSPGD